MKNKCIKEEHLVNYLEKRLSGPLLEKVERHLSQCDACLDALAIINKLSQDDTMDPLEHVPQRVTDQAVFAVLKSKREPIPGKIIKNLKKKGSDLKSALYDLICFSPSEYVHVRADKKTTTLKPVTVKKAMADFEVEIEIHNKGDRTAAIRVGVTLLKNGNSDHPVRVTLLEDSRELSSYPLKNPVVFESIAYGRYTLLFTRKGVKAGEYRFRIKDSLDG
jgi:hypothetical protein